MTARPQALLDACRVPESVTPGQRGLWEIRRVSFDDGSRMGALIEAAHGAALAPYRSLTMLHRKTLETMHRDVGECVMEDSPRELRRHLPILLAARGRVLVSGLGLGCVVRGLLAKPEVEHVDVVEIDPAILILAGGEFAENPRASLHLGDAETIAWPERTRWDFAWHDVWSEHEPLPLVHMRLFQRYADRCPRQGAWMMPRVATRKLDSSYIGGPRRRRVA